MKSFIILKLYVSLNFTLLLKRIIKKLVLKEHNIALNQCLQDILVSLLLLLKYIVRFEKP